MSQNASGPQVTSGNLHVAGSIRVSFNSPSGIAAVLGVDDVIFDLSWYSGVAETFSDREELTLTSLDGMGFARVPTLLGTFRLTGLSPETTSILVAELDPNSSDLITENGDILDPVTTASASITVRGVAAVPSPQASSRAPSQSSSP